MLNPIFNPLGRTIVTAWKAWERSNPPFSILLAGPQSANPLNEITARLPPGFWNSLLARLSPGTVHQSTFNRFEVQSSHVRSGRLPVLL